jgi:hypothetical protein
MSNKVVAVRLPAGEELMGRVVSENDYEIVLKDVHQVHTQWQPDGQVKFGMSPFMIFTKGEIAFLKASVTAMADVEGTLEKEYLTRTSGIILAK